jgi:hypothetical protein
MHRAVVAHKSTVYTCFIKLLNVPNEHHSVAVHCNHSLIFLIKSDREDVSKFCFVIGWNFYFANSGQDVGFSEWGRP